ELPDWHHVAYGEHFVRGQAALSVPGYDIVCPAADTARLTEAFVALGATRAGAETYDVLRVEAGMPVYGVDMDEERFVVEVGRTRQAISYTKGCYLGQEPIVMARDRGHVNRMLLGISVAPSPDAMRGSRGASAAIPKGVRLFRDNAEVGQITS